MRMASPDGRDDVLDVANGKRGQERQTASGTFCSAPLASEPDNFVNLTHSPSRVAEASSGRVSPALEISAGLFSPRLECTEGFRFFRILLLGLKLRKKSFMRGGGVLDPMAAVVKRDGLELANCGSQRRSQNLGYGIGLGSQCDADVWHASP